MKGFRLLLLRQIGSQLRTTEWRALLFATWIAIALATLLALLGDRLERGLLRESAAMLGADLVLSSQRPINPERIELARDAGLKTSEVAQFPSMIHVGEQMMLVSVRAATPPYPLRGQIRTQPEQPTPMPPPGEVWVEARILSQLGLAQGDSITLGYSELRIGAEMLSSPDRGTGFRSFSPQLVMHSDDLEATRILAPGSRAQFRLLMAGPGEILEQFETQLQSDLSSDERLFSLRSDQPMTGAALGGALSYLKLTALIALLLAALTIFLSLRRFSIGQHKRCALLLSLGMRANDLIRLYLCQLLIAWFILSLLGTLTGVLLEQLILSWLNELLPQQLPQPTAWRYLSGSAMGFALLILLGLPPVLQLSRVAVSSLFRDEVSGSDKRAVSIQLVCFTLLAAALLTFLEAPLAASTLLLLILIGGAVFGWIAQRCLRLLARPLAHKLLLGRLLLMRLEQQKRWHRLQAGVVILLMTLLSLVWISRTDLLADWQAQIPDNTPNYFVVNIQPWQTEPLETFLQQEGINSELYPMVRGRISTLNGEPIRAHMSPEQLEHNTLNRELNLSWNNQPPAHNRLVAGNWWTTDTSEAEISVESEMAEDLGLIPGDRLGFDLGGLTVEARITSLREVEWASFKPNFYVIFNQAALQDMPATFITSFRLTPEQDALATQLVREFPSLTLIDIGQLLQQIATWMQRLGDSSALILSLTLFCGALLMLLTLRQALDQRRYESALLQTLGASARQTQQLDLLELMLLGLVCGVLAVWTAEGTLALLYLYLLHLEPGLHPFMWMLLPAASTLFFTLSGALMRRQLTLPQCYRLLRTG
ncbi:ABC transporter permease [Nitrincola iocasae]|uniref:FtsX-like permease family protein n=1 Tax=Nitrincola iocasae TaxID=2614693 RepID=A0A5J6L935_9GAMM|nr:FtsX-like permease family protein [Nitrincola iocasae]QEW05169.1 FtsX-like permease family protein [Nitrincola iocasae]